MKIITNCRQWVDTGCTDPDTINIKDIAHALSNTCRWGGHTDHFYSVAQHSVLCSYECHHKMWGLMHDAAEAYLCDMPYPVKQALPNFQVYETDLLEVIAERFGLCFPLPDDVKEADLILYRTEIRDLFNDDWEEPLVEGVDPLPETIYPLCPAVAKEQFLNRWTELRLAGW